MWKSELLVGLGLLNFLISCHSISSPGIDCTVNGTYTGCGPACPETCKFDGLGHCVKGCGGPCACKPGYVIDQDIPACVRRIDCPPDAIQREGITYIWNFKCFARSRCAKKMRRG